MIPDCFVAESGSVAWHQGPALDVKLQRRNRLRLTQQSGRRVVVSFVDTEQVAETAINAMTFRIRSIFIISVVTIENYFKKLFWKNMNLQFPDRLFLFLLRVVLLTGLLCPQHFRPANLNRNNNQLKRKRKIEKKIKK